MSGNIGLCLCLEVEILVLAKFNQISIVGNSPSCSCEIKNSKRTVKIAIGTDRARLDKRRWGRNPSCPTKVPWSSKTIVVGNTEVVSCMTNDRRVQPSTPFYHRSKRSANGLEATAVYEDENLRVRPVRTCKRA